MTVETKRKIYKEIIQRMDGSIEFIFFIMLCDTLS